MITLKENHTPTAPVAYRATGVLAAVALLAASCGVTEEEPPEPDDQAEVPGQQMDDDAPEAQGDDDDEETDSPDEDAEPDPVVSQQAVTAGHQLAVDAGEQMLDEGGNAVDAAIAASFAIGVIEPVASGIGGGGSLIIAGPEGEPVFYDYREVVNNAGEIPDSHTGVPGFVAGMGQLHEDYGTLDWQQVLEPALELAQDGFEVTPYQASRMQDGAGYLTQNEVFSPDGAVLEAGDTLVQPELAETLQRLSEAGWEDYYTGELAESLVSAVDGVDTESLADYEVVVSEPVSGEFGDYEVVSAAPGLPGAALVQMLQIAEAQGVAQADPASAEYVDTMSRAWGVAEETIRNDLGDPNFVEVPVEELTDPQSNAEIEASGASSAQQGSVQLEEGNTTHLGVVDESGLTVSMTNTITDFWGSGQAVDGYFMNNSLYRFHDIDSPANQPEPGRRSVTWSNPTMILDSESRPVLSIGTPGGIQIVPTLATVMTQWGLQGRELQESVDELRFRGEGGSVFLEEGHQQEVIQELEQMGWSIDQSPSMAFGSIQALEIDYDSGTIIGAEDERRDGTYSIID